MRTKNPFGPRHGPQFMPRMSWHPKSLYNLIWNATNRNPATPGNFASTTKTIFQQQFISRRVVRAYHGDHIPEKRFKRFLLPVTLPSYISPEAQGSATPRPGGMFETIRKPAAAEQKLPIASLLVREIERRIDTCVFRLCFARSVWEARSMVLRGHVKLNGTKMTDPGYLMNPGDLVTVNPASIPLLTSKPFAVDEPAAETASEESAEGGEAAEEISSEADAKPAEDAPVEEGETKSEAAAEVETATEPSQDEGESSASAEAETSEKQEEPQASTPKGTLEEQKAARRAEREAAADARKAEKVANTKAREEEKAAEKKRLDEIEANRLLQTGVLRFQMPPFAGPSLFIPPYLEVSWATCSGIYLRHPTLTRSADGRTIRSDIPSPWSAASEVFASAWEFYVRRSPRTRGDQRRLKLEAKVGRNGFVTARAKDAWDRVKAKRRGWTTRTGQALVGSQKPKIRRDSSRARVKAPQLKRQTVAL